MYYAYILCNKGSDYHYYGHSQDVEKRLNQHNRGRVRSTKAHRPLELIYKESFKTKSEAYRREMFFKSIDGYRFLKDKGII